MTQRTTSAYAPAALRDAIAASGEESDSMDAAIVDDRDDSRTEHNGGGSSDDFSKDALARRRPLNRPDRLDEFFSGSDRIHELLSLL